MKRITILILALLYLFSNGYAQKSNISEDEFDGIWLLREMEIQGYQKELQFRGNEKENINLGYLLKVLFGLDTQSLSDLNILKNGQLTIITDNKKIVDFDILSPIKIKDKDTELRFDRTDYILTVKYRDNYNKEQKDKSISNAENTIIFHINNASGIYGKSVYKSVTACYPSNLIERNIIESQVQNRTFNFIVAYDYQTAEQAKEKYDGIIASINKKIEAKQDSILTPTELDILNAMYPDLNYNFYMGKKAMTDKRIFDAITYLKVVFNELNERLFMGKNLKNGLGDLYKQTSYLLGYNYMELGLHDLALRYLDFPGAEPTHDYLYVKEYISCLIAMRDFRAIYFIDEYIDKLEKEGITEHNANSYLFFNRRKAYILIEQGHYKEAQIYLDKVLAIDPNDRIALRESQYLKEQLKKE